MKVDAGVSFRCDACMPTPSTVEIVFVPVYAALTYRIRRQGHSGILQFHGWCVEMIILQTEAIGTIS